MIFIAFEVVAKNVGNDIWILLRPVTISKSFKTLIHILFVKIILVKAFTGLQP